MHHRDESGHPCTRHESPSRERLLELATIGSRSQGFHHDAASKLQSLVMALDEIAELTVNGQPELRAAVDIATTALHECQVMFNDNRALARGQRARIALPDAVARAAQRIGLAVRGEVTPCEVRVAVPAVIHALALLFDQIAGPRVVGRAIHVRCASDGDRVTLTLSGPEAIPAQASEALAIASFVIDREDGELRCAPDHVTLQLPIGVASQPIVKP